MASWQHIADKEALEVFSDDVGSLWCRPVAVLECPPDALTFLRDFVHLNVPCIIRNAITVNKNGNDDALRLSLDDIIDRVGEDVVLTVNVTPDGHGDCVRDVLIDSSSNIRDDGNKSLQRTESIRQMFVKPHEQQMSIAEFRQLLRKDCEFNKCSSKTEEKLATYPICNNTPGSCSDDETTNTSRRRTSPVVYYSKQCDCLRTEMKELFLTNIFPESFPFAEEAFGTGPPDAVNIWIGNEHSVSSTHKDFYDNLYYVCHGQKEFVLNPPADHVFLHEREFPCGTFTPVEAEANHGFEWAVTLDQDDRGSDSPEEVRTKWIEPDITKDNSDKKFPLLSKSHPMKVLVSEGEMLYIPSLWYHRVTQTCETVAVNYWYDMKFDSPHWCYFNFLQQLSRSQN
jgi:jumonji domain-containing protein 7